MNILACSCYRLSWLSSFWQAYKWKLSVLKVKSSELKDNYGVLFLGVIHKWSVSLSLNVETPCTFTHNVSKLLGAVLKIEQGPLPSCLSYHKAGSVGQSFWKNQRRQRSSGCYVTDTNILVGFSAPIKLLFCSCWVFLIVTLWFMFVPALFQKIQRFDVVWPKFTPFLLYFSIQT